MAVVTFNGLIGANAEVGAEVARILGYDYVDRLIMAEAAKRMGATVEAVEEKEARPIRTRARIARFLQRMVERSAAAGAGGDPYLGPGLDVVLGQQYGELEQELLTRAHHIDDAKFIQVTRAIIEETARQGNVVIISRGGNMILKGWPGVLHVGTTAPLANRIEVIMARERLDRLAAERYVYDNDRARIGYFKKFFNVAPDNPLHYHIVLNMGNLEVKTAANIVVHAVKEFTSQGPSGVS